MSKNKFHINGNGDVKPCNASKRACRFSDAEHFENKQEAVLYAERKLAEQYSQVSPTVSKNNTQFKKRISEALEQNKSVSPESLMKIGQVFDNELQNRLPFDIYGDVSTEDLRTIEQETHKLMSEVMNIGGSLKNDVYGSMGSKLDKAVSVLPNSVKDSLKNTKILAKSIRKDAADRDGMHQGNARFEATVVSQGVELSDFKKSLVENVPDGGVYTDSFISEREFNDKYFGTRAYVKNEGSDKYDVVWIGKPLNNKSTGKKLSDTVDVYIGGTSRKTTIQQPMYEVKDSYTLRGSVISAKKINFESDQSGVLLHEYVHLVQQNDYTNAEEEMFNELRETDAPKYDSGLGESCYEGFPDEYMGLYNGREVLTRASEGLYYPSSHSSQFLYGKNRGKNADKVRQWVAGYWLSKDRASKDKKDL